MMFLESLSPIHPDNLFNLEPKINTGLYINGEIKKQDKNSVAIVGTRKPDLYGIKITRKIAKSAVKNGFTVISGLARGIDTEAHRATIFSQGRTIAVIGNGLNNIYPEENVGLANEIEENGAVLSQFPPDLPPMRKNFPIRNKTVALLSKILFLVQAPIKSGSLITARLALEAGKTVFVVPGELGNPNFAGNFAFLKRNEKNPKVKLLLNDNFDEIFQQYSQYQTTIFDIKQNSTLSDEEKVVFDAIASSKNGLTFDEIAEISGKNSEDLPTIILSLVLSEIIEDIGGNTYKIKE